MGDRRMRFFVKVLLGAMPQLWLKISLAQLRFEEMSSFDCANLGVAMASSAYAVSQQLPVQYGIAKFEASSFLSMVFVLGMLLACSLRIIGLAACSSHIFNVL